MSENYIEEIIIWNDSVSADGTKQNAEQAFGLIQEEYNELVSAIENNDDVETLDAVVDLIWVLVGYAHNRGFDLLGAMEEVANSNFSKFILTEEQAEEEVARLRSEGVEGAHYVNIGDLFVLKDGSKKVRKPSSYIAADVSPYIGKAGVE